MKNHMRLICSLAVVLTGAALGFAQGAAPALPRVFAHDGKIDTSYDEVKGTTTARLNPMQVYGESLVSSNYVGDDWARFYASFTYTGRTSSAHPKGYSSH